MLLSSPIGSFVRDDGGWCFDPDIQAQKLEEDLDVYLGDLVEQLEERAFRKAPEDMEARLARSDLNARPPLRFSPSADARQKAEQRAATTSERRLQQTRMHANLHRLDRLTPELETLRTRRVQVLEHGPKGGIACAPAHAIPQRLTELNAFVARNHRRSPALTAIHTYGLFLLIHPFADSNGRTARQLMAAMLQPEGCGEPLLFAPVINLFEGDNSEAMADLIFRGGWAAFTARIAEMIKLYIEAENAIFACELKSIHPYYA